MFHTKCGQSKKDSTKTRKDCTNGIQRNGGTGARKQLTTSNPDVSGMVYESKALASKRRGAMAGNTSSLLEREYVEGECDVNVSKARTN